ncbi:polysaccharide pyruvyl transferase family protein [Alistipes indistinctus]|nr:polysaccharide pyruvyl transferase family protein [Alistipes indistinctus]
MKIGILTLFDQVSYNYGGTLQCLAMQNILKSMGHDVIVINYQSDEHKSLVFKVLSRLSSITNCNELVGFFSDLCTDLSRIINNKASRYNLSNPLFESLINQKFSLTPVVNEKQIAFIANSLDAIIVGSDQVWSGFAKKQLVYLFDWIPEYKGLRISYAACSSRPRVPRLNQRKISVLLNKMNAISVRDIQTSKLVHQVSGMTPTIVLDPTFLYDFHNEEEDITINGAYIFAYCLGTEIRGGFSKTFQYIKSQHPNAKIVTINIPGFGEKIQKYADIILDQCSPGQWITLIKNAELVFTDSFHGVCFSLKYSKPFIAFYSLQWRASRLLDIKQRFKLDRYIVTSWQEIRDRKAIINKPDYTILQSQLQTLIENSWDYLHSALIPAKHE